jgi:N-acyl-D-aspartate/D-glutamate deacylase
VIDGTGSPRFEADVGIDGERIAAIGKNLARGEREIDARGNVVAPGFVDSHTHMDLFLVLYPHGNPVVNYGVTTVVIGDCGASCAPVPDGDGPLQVLVSYLKRVLDNTSTRRRGSGKPFRSTSGTCAAASESTSLH